MGHQVPANSYCQLTLQAMADAVIRTNAEGFIDYINPAAEKLIARSFDSVLGKRPEQVFDLVPDNTLHVKGEILRDLTGNSEIDRKQSSGLLQLVAENITPCSISVTFSKIQSENDDFLGTVLVLHEANEITQIAEDLAFHARHDSLTGLMNRREFENRLIKAVSSAHFDNKQHVLCYLDLDNFKLVNDGGGHAAGDALLKQLTQLLKQRVRGADVLARLGGDEFAILMYNCSLEVAAKVNNELVDLIKQFSFIWQGRIFQVGVSIGLMPIGQHVGTAQDVMAEADAACYTAKRAGRNQIHVQKADSQILHQHGNIEWVQRLSEAMSNDQFMLYSQPIMALDKSSNGAQFHELLLRMKTESGEVLSPDIFMPQAERYRLMDEVDCWTIFQAATYVAKNNKRFEGNGNITSTPEKAGNQFAINLSAQSLTDKKLVKFVDNTLDELQVAPESICFDLPESAVITHNDCAIEVINQLRDIGCRIALDDFGNGFGSFPYLKRLEVDYIKLDQHVVKEVSDQGAGLAIASSINQVAHTLGIKTIAEHVENKTTLNALREVGVDYVQGYAIQEPEALYA